MKIKGKQSLSLANKLVMTTQIQFAIKLLQLNSTELQKEIDEKLQSPEYREMLGTINWQDKNTGGPMGILDKPFDAKVCDIGTGSGKGPGAGKRIMIPKLLSDGRQEVHRDTGDPLYVTLEARDHEIFVDAETGDVLVGKQQAKFIGRDKDGQDLYRKHLGMETCYSGDPSRYDLKNAILPAGNETFVELLQPTTPDSSASNHLKRRGESPYILIFETSDYDRLILHLNSMGVRLSEEPSLGEYRHAFIHPSSTNGALLELSLIHI